ncbi:unnamed protein product [Pieris macdunnoughi]|uniref:Uncharacterized protein n=1 Tax=Pieris macdunnoughi TaxID=345717 RepID=A0A821Q331_9NEOP|nr:unnamed protein product [Pieris macdunnoughi]
MTRSSYRPLVPRSSNNSLDNREIGSGLMDPQVWRPDGSLSAFWYLYTGLFEVWKMLDTSDPKKAIVFVNYAQS